MIEPLDTTPPAEEGKHDAVPVWLALIVLFLLLAVMAVGGWLLRGAFAGRDATDQTSLDVRQWEQRVAAAPEDMQARLNLAFAYQRAQRFKEAIESYDVVLRADPRDTAALYNKGLIYRELGMDDEAEVTLWDVLEIEPTHALAASALGELYAERGHYRSIVEAVRPAAEANPRAADLQYLMGLAYENTGHPDWAEARYRMALTYVPDMEKAREGLARLGKTQ